MASDAVAIKAIHAAKDVILAVVGAVVFVYGLLHAIPLTTEAVEYVAVYGAYFGIHVYSSASASKAGIVTQNIPATPK